MIYFGKVKNTEDYGFDYIETTFEEYIEVTEEMHENIISQANEEQKLIKADKDGKPILVERPQPSKQEINSAKIEELQNFLKDTDWYVYRAMETETPIPEDIKKKRAEAREEISKLREELKK